MRGVHFIAALILAGLCLAALPQTASAAVNCGQQWAVPGEYYVSGNFRGHKEATVIRLSNNCRVHFQVPGVFSGGPVRVTGQCVQFEFKVKGAPNPLQAEWCDDSGVVPWNGREIKVKVWQSRRQESQRATF